VVRAQTWARWMNATRDSLVSSLSAFSTFCVWPDCDLAAAARVSTLAWFREEHARGERDDERADEQVQVQM
jgi:hypothetical protein